jgi:hypothetical protein
LVVDELLGTFVVGVTGVEGNAMPTFVPGTADSGVPISHDFLRIGGLVAVGVGFVPLPASHTNGLPFEMYSMKLVGQQEVVDFLMEKAWFFKGDAATFAALASTLPGGIPGIYAVGGVHDTELDTFFFGPLANPEDSLWLVLNLGQEWQQGTTVLQYLQGGGTLEIEVRGAVTPEPATLAVLGLGLAGLGIARRRMKK